MKFVADDGRVFYNYEEREQYEKTNNQLTEYACIFYNAITTYNRSGIITKPTIQFQNNPLEYWKELIILLDSPDASYISISEKIDVNKWKKIIEFIYEEYDIALPPTPGIWRYDYKQQKWISFFDDVDYLTEKWSLIYPKLQVTQK